MYIAIVSVECLFDLILIFASSGRVMCLFSGGWLALRLLKGTAGCGVDDPPGPTLLRRVGEVMMISIRAG